MLEKKDCNPMMIINKFHEVKVKKVPEIIETNNIELLTAIEG